MISRTASSLVPSLFLVLFVLLVPHPLAAGVERWTGSGPTEDWINDVVIDPLNPSNVYAGSAVDGVLALSEDGRGWRPTGLGGILVHELALDPDDPALLYALTEDAHGTVVWRSTNAGDSWTAFGAELPSPMQALVLDPTSSADLWVAAFDGRVYHSSDAAESWTLVGPVDPAGHASVRDLALDPADPSLLLAAADEGLFRSADGGASWTRVAAVEARQVLIDPLEPAAWAASAAGVLKSTDGGLTWSPRPSLGSASALTLDSASATVYAASNGGLFRSADGGLTWTAIERGLAGYSPLDLAFVPGDPLTLYASFVNGVWRTTSGGGRFEPLDDGLRRAPSYEVAAVPGSGVPGSSAPGSGALYALTVHGLHRSLDGGRDWRPVPTPGIPLGLATGPDGAVFIAVGDFVYRSDDSGERWERLNVASPVRFLRLLRVDPQAPEILYGASFDEVYKSLDGGTSWQPAGDAFGRFIIDLAIDAATPERLYAATARGLMSSSDGGESWSESELPVDDRLVTAVAVDPFGTPPGAPSPVYVSLGRSRVLRSADGGLTWLETTPVGTGPVNDLLVVPAPTSTAAAPAGDLYAATEMGGVWRSHDQGGSWQRVDSTRLVDPSNGRVPTITALAAGQSGPGSSGVHAATEAGVFSRRAFEKRVLALQDGRFEVEVRWRDFGGMTGTGQVAAVGASLEPAPAPGAGEPEAAVPLRSRDSAVLEFFSEENWEMLLKVLDGRAANGRFWVFLAAATDVGFTATVTDTSCDVTRSYVNPLSLAAPAVTDTEAFEPCSSPAPSTCTVEDGVLCLGEPVPGSVGQPLADGRFRVEVEWRDALGQTDRARQVTVPEEGFAESDDSGLFYFFSAENWELLVKVLDGCSVNGHYWVFGAATTDVEYQLTVRDTLTGAVSNYRNPLGVAASAITDTSAFATCGAR